jgi:hypothetical protein
MARSTFRSVTYDLDAAVAVARYVSRSDAGVSSHELAPALGYSGVKNGAFLTRLANARLFGLVAGSSSQVTLSDRGRRALSPDGAASAAARAEAFLSVPLFRAVFDQYADRRIPGPDDLESVLRTDFGEPDAKARVSAAKLLDSARQAQLIRAQPDGTMRFTSDFDPFTDFTDGGGRPPRVGLQSPVGDRSGEHVLGGGRVLRTGSLASASRRGAGEVGAPMASTGGTDGGHDDPNGGIWLEEEGPARSRTGVLRRRTAVVAAVAVCLVVAAIPVSLALSGSSAPIHHPAADQIVKGTHLGTAAGGSRVLAALSATTDAGNFNFTYNLTGQPPTTPTPTTTTQVCNPISVPYNGSDELGQASSVAPGGVVVEPNIQPATGASSTGGTECENIGSEPLTNVPVTGSGTINVNPTAVLTTAAVGTGLNVVVRVSSTDYWEDVGGTSTGLAPPSDDSTGAPEPIDGAAGLVEGTLGDREGGVAMMGLASPSGYLDLYQSEVTTAADLGPSTVDGVPVTVYEVQVTPAEEGQVVGATSDEQTTITQALALLQSQGYTGSTVQISIDSEGYIRQSDTTANFSDGGSVNLTATFSNFGCAGTVLFPGQTGPSSPPTNCTSPVPTTTTTTPTTAPAGPTATTAPDTATSTTVGTSTPTTAPTATTAPGTGTTGPPSSSPTTTAAPTG